LSPDGKCHTFDAKANGFVPGEGCGAVVLKRLDKARRDGDHIYAVIEASAVNNDGHTMGVTTPDLEAQKEVTRAALRRSGVDPRTITYIETHGTGTMIGDPVELKGLTQVFSAFTPERQFCAVGSVKTNLGHLLNAAGAAGLLKVLVALEHRQLPPTLNCENPNPRFDFGQSPFYPVTRLEPWEGVNGVLRAAVTSLGFGGTNAHLILSRPVEPAVPSRRSPLPPLKFNRARLWPRPAKTPAPVDPKAAGLGSLLEERASGAALGSADEAPTVIMNSQSPRWQAPAAARRPLLSLEEEVAGA